MKIKKTRSPSSYKGLITLWTIKSSLAPLKYVIGHWTHPGIVLIYIKKKNVRVTMELEVPKGLYSTLHYPLLWFNKFCSGRDKKVLSLQMSGDHGNEMLFLIFNFLIFFRSSVFHTYKKRSEKGGKGQKHEENSPKCHFRIYIKKISTSTS